MGQVCNFFFAICFPDSLPINWRIKIKIEAAGQTIPISFSAGSANYISGESADDLLRRADEALYANKRGEKTADEMNIPVQ